MDGLASASYISKNIEAVADSNGVYAGHAKRSFQMFKSAEIVT